MAAGAAFPGTAVIVQLWAQKRPQSPRRNAAPTIYNERLTTTLQDSGGCCETIII